MQDEGDGRDDWDVGSGVGVTAVAVAAARALESERADRLVADDYAAALVRAAPVAMPARAADLTAEDGAFWDQMRTATALRSRLFDDHLLEVARDGVPQVVILGAGLDVRPYRLDWPPHTVVHTIDRPRVLRFVDEVLRAEGAEPACTLRTVPADLRGDWVSALRSAGFRADRPTAWLAEGLLVYLPAEAEAALFAAVDALSAPGSRIAVEVSDPGLVEAVRRDPLMSGSQERFGVSMPDLWDFSPRPPAPDRLRAGGWDVEVHTVAEVAHRHGRAVGGTGAQAVSAARLVLGARVGP